MLFLLSPSKTQDFDKSTLTNQKSKILFPDQVKDIIAALRNYNLAEIKKLMNISTIIANDTLKKISRFDQNIKTEKQAILAYTGQVFKGFDLKNYTKEDFVFLKDHLLIFSALYGLLRPFDQIRPYRLEMKAKLKIRDFQNLYKLWKIPLSKYINSRKKDNIIINLASKEYFDAIDAKKINAKIINPVFKDLKGEKYRVVAIFAKQARGEMVNWAVKNRAKTPKDLQNFSEMGYKFCSKSSNDHQMVFLR